MTARNNHLILRATKLLDDLKDAVNANSDGWPYWMPPKRAAKKLEALINDCREEDLTEEKLKKAITPIKSFYTKWRKGGWGSLPGQFRGPELEFNPKPEPVKPAPTTADRELATILAALRQLQRTSTICARAVDGSKWERVFNNPSLGIKDILDEGGTHLTDDEIDELCERLNCGGYPVAAKPRVIVCVEGGNVWGARANCDVDLDILDYDNLEASEDGSDEQIALKTLEAEYPDLPEALY